MLTQFMSFLERKPHFINLKVGQTRLLHTAYHTEYAGPGRVFAVSFLGGAGYCPNAWAARMNRYTASWPVSPFRGFTVKIRLCPWGRKNPYDPTGRMYRRRRFAITTDPNWIMI